MKALLPLLALLAFTSCKDKDQAADWSQAGPTPLQARLAEKRTDRMATGEAAKKTDAAMLRLEATSKVAEIAVAMESLAKSVNALAELEQSAGESPNPAVQAGMRNLRASQADMVREAETLMKCLDDYRPHIEEPALVDRMKEAFASLKQAAGR